MFLVAAVVCGAMWLVMETLGSAWLAALAALLLLASVSAFLVPTHYVLDDDGVEQRRLWTTRRRAWRDLRRVQIGPGAALVSPFARATWMDRTRGILLYLDGADRDRVIAVLRERLP